jgi:hypothetical protein
VYKHYKNKLYKVIALARNSEDEEQFFVVYQSLYAGDFPQGTVWTRKLRDFVAMVDVGGNKVKRFMIQPLPE